MPEPTRYAIYYMCPPGPLADFGAGWLGWDAARGRISPHPDVADLPLPIEAITRTPRKYGFHGTIKPPFQLAPGRDAAELEAAAVALCQGLAPVSLDGLALSRLGGFLALTVTGDTAPLAALAAACVAGLDAFRAPALQQELARRRVSGLSPQQEALLTRWGYPYVMEEFRFHMTLSGRLPAESADAIRSALARRITPLLPRPFAVGEFCLMRSDTQGRFHLLRRLPLGGLPLRNADAAPG
ncbi:DUF1045 domain-containing protein [Pseudooceanicola sp.]|uniref:DUF1045 domain-containing protein n=1 Tax=Pseudooceanicola sp. TaxID=1914328 RepID=UPI00261531EE|nr:DUF1045 domain-containing protein [Pseudooceanicola sp.]MDF1854868.1 DUF1045 domain-containing protein [Pseudooceanicola sp.]